MNAKSKKFLALFCFSLLTFMAAAPIQADSARGRVVVMLGDSLTAGNDWSASFPASEYPGLKVYNQGISGDTTIQILRRLNEVVRLKPDAVFLQAGINDLGLSDSPWAIVGRHRKIWRILAERIPGVRLQVQSLLPLSEKRYPGKNEMVREINILLKEAAENQGIEFIDLYRPLAGPDGGLRDEFTFDGLHLKAPAYERWANEIKPYL